MAILAMTILLSAYMEVKQMSLHLTKPLIVFDLETTGLDLVKDRIIQISYIKISPNGEELKENIFINPQKAIPSEVTELTGISNERVKDAPTFKQKAKELANIFQGCDFAGFNSNRFDIPMLAEEFLRSGIDFDFSKCNLIDVQNIYHKMERRNLAAAYQFYCGRKMEDDFSAHRADQDTEATWKVLQGQIKMYSSENQSEASRILQDNIEALADFSKMNNFVDFAGRMIWEEVKDGKGNILLDNNGKPLKQEVFNFGKYKGIPVIDVLHKDPGYYSWMLTSDFTYNTKQILTRIRLRDFNKNKK